MSSYTIDNSVFEMFPGFRRGVVVATGIDNRHAAPEAAQQLSRAVSLVSPTPSATETLRIEAWNSAYAKFGVDPNRFTPSIRFLFEQIRRGKPPRSINTAVDIMNASSIRWMTPCGGDDLGALDGGDLRLGIAQGDETFAPLFKPTSVDHPNPGEIIYFTPQSNRVLCRRWTWRNSDFSKLTADTKTLGINIDMIMPPLIESDLECALQDVSKLIAKYCGGSTTCHILSPSRPRIEISLD